MARKTSTITIDKKNRDKGKSFFLTEMDAWQAYDWAGRVFFALMNTGADIPQPMIDAGMAGIAVMSQSDFMRFVFSMMAKVPYAEAKPILDHLLTCAEILPNPKDDRIKRAIMEDDIEELSTILTIQKAVFGLHFGFFGQGGSSTTDTQSQETAA
jgi:hypothetical protein